MLLFKHLLISATLFVWPSASFASYWVGCPQGTREVKDLDNHEAYLSVENGKPGSFQKCRRLTWREYNPDENSPGKTFGYRADNPSYHVKCGDITIKTVNSKREWADPVADGGIEVHAKSGGTVHFSLLYGRVKDGVGGSEVVFIADCVTPGARQWLSRHKVEYRGYSNGISIASKVARENKCTSIEQSGDKYFKRISFTSPWKSKLTDKVLWSHHVIRTGKVCKKVEVF